MILPPLVFPVWGKRSNLFGLFTNDEEKSLIALTQGGDNDGIRRVHVSRQQHTKSGNRKSFRTGMIESQVFPKVRLVSKFFILA